MVTLRNGADQERTRLWPLLRALVLILTERSRVPGAGRVTPFQCAHSKVQTHSSFCPCISGAFFLLLPRSGIRMAGGPRQCSLQPDG